ncbi:MAG: hypothetical protein H7268_00810 [Sandarakinorhabdus sp.]|nr:hypothetical protein [Sandarakinorhabdus sp.]
MMILRAAPTAGALAWATMFAVPAQAIIPPNVPVAGSASIWLAGQPAAATVSGYFGSDIAPVNAPVALTVTAAVLNFFATGSTSVDGSCFAGSAGGCYADQSGFSPSPWGGLYNGPASALVGIFLDTTTPTLGTVGGYQGPTSFGAGPDYQLAANVGAGTFAPALGQVFYIGDGNSKYFAAPTGATRLYLGIADAIGAKL